MDKKETSIIQTILMTKSLDKRETIILLITNLTMNNFKKTTATLTHDKKVIPITYIFIFKNLQWQKYQQKRNICKWCKFLFKQMTLMTNLTSDEQSRQKRRLINPKCKSIHHTNDKKSQQRKKLVKTIKNNMYC